MEVKGVVAQTTELKRCPIIPLHLTTTTHSGVDPLERIVWKDHLVLLPRVGKILVLDCHHSDDPMGPWVEWELPVGWINRWSTYSLNPVIGWIIYRLLALVGLLLALDNAVEKRDADRQVRDIPTAC